MEKQHSSLNLFRSPRPLVSMRQSTKSWAFRHTRGCANCLVNSWINTRWCFGPACVGGQNICPFPVNTGPVYSLLSLSKYKNLDVNKKKKPKLTHSHLYIWSWWLNPQSPWNDLIEGSVGGWRAKVEIVILKDQNVAILGFDEMDKIFQSTRPINYLIRAQEASDEKTE